MKSITLPTWAFIVVPLGVLYLYGVTNLNNVLPSPRNGWKFSFGAK